MTMFIKAALAALTALVAAALTPCIEGTELVVFPPELEDAGCGTAFDGPEVAEVVGRIAVAVEGTLVRKLVRNFIVNLLKAIFD